MAVMVVVTMMMVVGRGGERRDREGRQQRGDKQRLDQFHESLLRWSVSRGAVHGSLMLRP
jgi:hypothetical protein